MSEQVIDSIIEGMLLGDAYITKKNVFGFNHSSVQKEYFQHKVDLFSAHDIKLRLSEETTTGSLINDRLIKGGQKLNARTTKTHKWVELREKWYPQGRKIVPKDLRLTPEMLAYWYMDDGSANMRSKHTSCINGERYIYECEPYINQIRLYTDGFDRDSQDFLEQQFLFLGIHSRHYQRPSGARFLVIAQKQSKELFKELVLSTIKFVPSMCYKIDRPLQSHFERLSEGAPTELGRCDSPTSYEE